MYPVEADIILPDLKRSYWSEFVCVGRLVRTHTKSLVSHEGSVLAVCTKCTAHVMQNVKHSAIGCLMRKDAEAVI